MRNLEFNDLNLKENLTEYEFYNSYINNFEQLGLQNQYNIPNKNYEIFFLNILGGKIILLDVNHLRNNDSNDKELYFDYSIALKIYNYYIDIYDGLLAENFEFNELYKNERLEHDEKISQLKLEDEQLFSKALLDFKNSELYMQYNELINENKELKSKNFELVQQQKIYDSSFTIKLISSFKKKLKKRFNLLDSGDN